MRWSHVPGHIVVVLTVSLSSPAAFEHRDVVLLSSPRREVDARLQSVLVERLQDHSLCIHIYASEKEAASFGAYPWQHGRGLCMFSYPDCPPGSREWWWASDTCLLWCCFSRMSDGSGENKKVAMDYEECRLEPAHYSDTPETFSSLGSGKSLLHLYLCINKLMMWRRYRCTVVTWVLWWSYLLCSYCTAFVTVQIWNHIVQKYHCMSRNNQLST